MPGTASNRIAFLLFCAVVTWTAGCRAPDKGDKPIKTIVRVSPSPVPSLSLPEINTNRIDRRLIPAERATLKSEEQQHFAAAREAFWNGDTDAAVASWRALWTNASAPKERRHFEHLIVQAYAADRRWSEARAALEKFDPSARQRERLEDFRFREALPARTMTFGNDSTIPFELKLGQLIKARARVNGVEAIVFVDTGFTDSFLTADFALRSGITNAGHRIVSVDVHGARRFVRAGVVDTLEFGGATIRHLPVVCGSKKLLGTFLGDVDLVIGWDVLRDIDVTFDFPARQLLLKEPPAIEPTEPLLSGRRFPVMAARSAEGRELNLFLDTGFASDKPSLELARNAGLLGSKLDATHMRRSWRPTFTVAMNSFGIRWPKRISPCSFWFDGHMFEVRHAMVTDRVDVREGLHVCDGTVGNAPFLGGKLRVCGARRIVSFTPAPAP